MTLEGLYAPCDSAVSIVRLSELANGNSQENRPIGYCHGKNVALELLSGGCCIRFMRCSSGFRGEEAMRGETRH